jgi:CRP-like cAMP-binding protein
MDETRPFFLFLHKFVPLSEQEFDRWVRPFVQTRTFRKREIITRAGEVEEHLNYLLAGLVRKFYLHGEEQIVTQLSTEGHIIHAQESFHSRTPSEFSIEAIEPTTMLSITYEDLERVYSQDAKLERLGRLVVTFSMVLKDRWQVNLIRLSPRERFLDFVHKNPELLQRVPQKYLASYLNIQPETFSRFKHLLRNRRPPGT